MKLYYINRNPNSSGEHELHLATCSELPNIFNRACLGDFKLLSEATLEAKKLYPSVTNCNHCLNSKTQPEKKEPFYKK